MSINYKITEDYEEEHHEMPMESEVPTTGGIRHNERSKGFWVRRKVLHLQH